MAVTRLAVWACSVIVVGGAVLAIATAASMQSVPRDLDAVLGDARRAEVVDRHGLRLSVTYENDWNLDDRVALHEVPALLRRAIIEAEDRRFDEHDGVDWRARLAATWQNLRAGRAVRGASTITEQVIRMIHPRPRTLWSRWVEGFEAIRLERHVSKADILAFYLNQVPYSHRRRGVVQAARDLFDRDLETLAPDEMIALAVLVRSPSRLDPRAGTVGLRSRSKRLAARLVGLGALPSDAAARIGSHPFDLREARLPLSAPAFVRHARETAGATTRIETTLDAALQARLQTHLDERIARLAQRGVRHGALMVVDHVDDQVLVWANATSDSQIDAVLTPRQPGSTLKPFVYALALENGWTAATLIDDSPITASVGSGLHSYRNYSGLNRGPIRLRLALANSLNIPAIRAMRSLPRGALYRRLRALGFASLDLNPEHYGDGLALGNGEVTLYEMVAAYATLARGGIQAPLEILRGARPGPDPRRVRLFDREVTHLVTDILADADARSLEFGRGGVLELPFPAAVKTGTSNDYRDAWALGFTDRYTVGVWMGALDRSPMKDVTGALGPAVVLRAALTELHRFEPAGRLALSRSLRRVKVCAVSGRLAGAHCPAIEEWFRPAHAPVEDCDVHGPHPGPLEPVEAATGVALLQPTEGLHLAADPRIPDPLEVFEFVLEAGSALRAGSSTVEWFVDDAAQDLRRVSDTRWEWPVRPGEHRVRARVHLTPSTPPSETREVRFFVR